MPPAVVPLVQCGIRHDLAQLLATFRQQHSVRFQAFAKVFREMEFALIFAGRQSVIELLEFSELLLQAAAEYMLPTRTLKETPYPVEGTRYILPRVEDTTTEHVAVDRIFGVYACYALFYMQPHDCRAQIRVTPSLLLEMNEFVTGRLIPERHVDVVAAYQKLVDDGAFRIIAYEKSYDPVYHKRSEREELEEAQDFEEPLSRLKPIATDKIVKQLDILFKRYEATKKTNALTTVSVGELNVAQSVRDAYAKAQRQLSHPEEDASKPTTLSPMKAASSKSDIKQNAYNQLAKASRNRRYAFNEQELALMDEMPTSSQESEAPAPPPPPPKKKRAKKTRQIFSRRESLPDEEFEHGIDLPSGTKPPKRTKGTKPKEAEAPTAKADSNDLLASLDAAPSPRKRRGKPPQPPLDPAFTNSIMKMVTSKEEREVNRRMEALKKALKDS